MSNEMFLIEATFHISRGQEKAAEVALREATRNVLEKKDVHAGDIQTMIEKAESKIEQLTLDQLVMCWGWSLIRDHNGTEVVGIELLEDFSSDEERLFKVLGPFVTAGSYIDLAGNSTGGYWKTSYGFTGQQVVELELIFPPLIPLSQTQRATDADRQESEPQAETPAQLILRLSAALPSLWEALQQTPFDEDLWTKIDNVSFMKIGSLVDNLEEAAQVGAEQLGITSQQALLILLETAFQRLR